jgi:hypothetical protein
MPDEMANRLFLRSAMSKQIRPKPIIKKPIAAHTIETHNKNPPMSRTAPEKRITEPTKMTCSHYAIKVADGNRKAGTAAARVWH